MVIAIELVLTPKYTSSDATVYGVVLIIVIGKIMPPPPNAKESTYVFVAKWLPIVGPLVEITFAKVGVEVVAKF